MKLEPRNDDLGLNLFDDIFKNPFFRSDNDIESMNTDIQKKDNNYILTMDLQGYKKEDIKAHLKDGYLIITAQKDISNEEKDDEGNYIKRERHYDKNSRSFYVGDDVKQEDIKANFYNGILKISYSKQIDGEDKDIITD